MLKAVALAAAFLSCQTKPEKDAATELLEKRSTTFTNTVLPGIQQHLDTGFIIFRMGTDITSQMFAAINEKDKRYSHCGVLSHENGVWFVYHAIGGETNPEQMMWREPLQWFAAPLESKAIGIFSPELLPHQRKHLVSTVKAWYAMQLLFDMQFDLSTNTKMYCAEMVAKSLMVARNNADWLTTTQLRGRPYITIENLTLNSGLKEIATFTY